MSPTLDGAGRARTARGDRVSLAEGRYLDRLVRLGDARVRWPHDLELLRSVRVLEHHLKLRATQTG